MPGQMFTWDDLQFFLAVARTGQLSSAARRLRSSHATVSRRIDRLEFALSVKLFERNPRGYVLTSIGQRFLSTAEKIEEETERLQHELTDGISPLRGAVRLSILEGFGNFFLADRLHRFDTQYPNISLEMVTIQQIMSLSRKEADLQVSLDVPKTGPYLSEKLTDYTLLVYGAESYLAKHAPITDPAQLADHPFIGYIDDMIFTPGLDYLGEIMPGLTAHFQSSSILTQMKATQQRMGLCVLPTFIARTDPQLKPVLARRIRLKRAYWLMIPEQTNYLSSVRGVADFLRAAVREAAGFFD